MSRYLHNKNIVTSIWLLFTLLYAVRIIFILQLAICISVPRKSECDKDNVSFVHLHTLWSVYRHHHAACCRQTDNLEGRIKVRDISWWILAAVEIWEIQIRRFQSMIWQVDLLGPSRCYDWLIYKWLTRPTTDDIFTKDNIDDLITNDLPGLWLMT